MDLQDSNFLETLEKEELALVDFWAPWCGPCRVLEPVLLKVAGDLKIPLYKVMVDDNPEAPARYGVQGLPTVMLFRRGQEAGRIVGAQPEAKLRLAIEDLL